MSDQVFVTARPSPFSVDKKVVALPPGLMLSQLVERVIEQPWLRSWACVAVDGVLVPPWALPFRRTEPGEHVTVTTIPRGGSNGGSKNTWAIVLSVVVIVASVALQQYWAAGVASGTINAGTGAALALGTSIGGMAAMLAINRLLPPRPPHGGTR
jgi:predicted phage tail protein